jgi:hypothetical protein
LVDGFVVENALYGDMGMDISRNAISEISMITGAFNAEYGEATSGVINIVTKEGKSNYSWHLRGVSDKILNPDVHGQDLYRMEGSLSGPVLPMKPNLATFFFNADILKTRSAMWKNRLPYDILKEDMDNDGIFDPADGDSLAVADLITDGKYDPVELKKGVIEINDIFSSQNRYSGKLVLRPLQKLKIVASINEYYNKVKGFSMDYRLIPEKNSTGIERTRDLQLKTSYTISKNMFFDIKYHRYSRNQWNGYEPHLNDRHELYTEIFTIPEEWEGSIPSSLTPGGDFLWLSYYAEPFMDLNGDGSWNQYAAEYWKDDNGNGVWDNGEYYNDWNGDGEWNMWDLDNDGHPDEEPYQDMDGDSEYTLGVDPPVSSPDAYDGTAPYWFWGDYEIFNNYGDTVRIATSTNHDY